MGEKFTKLEQQALEAKRRGNQVAVDQQRQAEGPPVVTLREFTERRGVTPPAAPGPLPPPPMAQVPESPPVPEETPRPVTGQVSEADLEALKSSMFGAAEAVESEEKKEEPKEDLFRPNRCQRCGWVLENQALHEPTDEDKVEFIESILGGRRFDRVVEFLGGRLKGRYRTVLVEEEDAITAHLNDFMDKKTVQNQAEWTLAYIRARLVVMLSELHLRGAVHRYPTINEYEGANLMEKLRVALDKVPKGWPLTIHGLLVQGMESVNDIYQVLMSRAYDPNFWEGQVGV